MNMVARLLLLELFIGGFILGSMFLPSETLNEVQFGFYIFGFSTGGLCIALLVDLGLVK